MLTFEFWLYKGHVLTLRGKILKKYINFIGFQL